MKMSRFAQVAVGVGLLAVMVSGGVVNAQPTGDTKPVPKGEAVVGINRGGFDDGGSNLWTYEGQKGEILSLSVVAEKPANKADQETRDKDNLLDPEVFVYDPDGEVIATNDDIVEGILTDSFLRSVELTAAGTYSIEVTNWFRKRGDETQGHFELIVRSLKNPPKEGKTPTKILETIDSTTAVMDTVERIIERFDRHTVILVNPTGFSISKGFFGDVNFTLAPYSGMVVQVPFGAHELSAKSSDCTIRSGKYDVPETAVIMVTSVSECSSSPSKPAPNKPDLLGYGEGVTILPTLSSGE